MLKIDLYYMFGRVVFFLLVSFILIAGNLSLMLSLFVAEYLLITKVLSIISFLFCYDFNEF